MEAWLAAAVRLAVPLWIAALGELVVQRAGVVNIGIEGMMLTGAFAAFVASVLGASALTAGAAGMGAAALLGLVFAWFAVGRRADMIVVGTALNLLALGLTGTASRRLWRGAAPTLAGVERLHPPWLSDLAGVGPVLFQQSVFAYLALALAVGIGAMLAYTQLGLRLRAVGECASAADAEGVSVEGTRTAAVLFGASLAGLAGSALTLSQSDTFTEGMTAGRGFIALTLVLFGAWRATGVLAAGLFFGAAMALQFRLQARGLDLPYPAFLMLPYLLTLAALSLASTHSRGPGDLGRAFRRGESDG